VAAELVARMKNLGLLLVGLLLLARAAGAAEVNGTVTIEGSRAPDAVVYLEGDGASPEPGSMTMDQKNLTFLPRVLAVQKGTRVDFTNSDGVQHNVFSPSKPGHFNLGTYSRGDSRSITLNEPGDVVVLCNIHMEMEAHILVLDGPHFASTDTAGAYRLAEVPAGTYTAKVWQRGWLGPPRSVVVGDAPLVLDFELKR